MSTHVSPIKLDNGMQLILNSTGNIRVTQIQMTSAGLSVGASGVQTIIQGSLLVNETTSVPQGIDFGGGYTMKFNSVTGTLDIIGS